MTVSRQLGQEADELPDRWFRDLKVGHDPKDPAEATLVLAAAAAANGLRCDGKPMHNVGSVRPASARGIARQLRMPIGSARRGIQHLIRVGAIYSDHGIRVRPAALGDRWANHRQRIHITTEARFFDLPPRALLLTGLVQGQVNKQNRLRLGIAFLMERTGFCKRTLERHLATARASGAIHTWITPNDWQLYLGAGSSTQNARCEDGGVEIEHANNGREVAVALVGKWRKGGREVAVGWSGSGVRHPETSGVLPESPPEKPAAPAGDPGPSPPSAAPDPQSSGAPAICLQAVIDKWVVDFAQAGVERLTEKHAFEVVGLVDRLGPLPDVIRSNHAFRAERMALAKRVIAWCPSPERLGRWLTRVTRWFGVNNLAAYLRCAAERGDPGTVLEGGSRRRFGRGADNLRDFSAATEQQLVGPHANAVAELLAEATEVMSVPLGPDRDRLRAELQNYLTQHRPAAARAVLLQLIGKERSDIAIARAVGSACSLAQAKELLAA